MNKYESLYTIQAYVCSEFIAFISYSGSTEHCCVSLMVLETFVNVLFLLLVFHVGSVCRSYVLYQIIILLGSAGIFFCNEYLYIFFMTFTLNRMIVCINLFYITILYFKTWEFLHYATTSVFQIIVFSYWIDIVAFSMKENMLFL